MDEVKDLDYYKFHTAMGDGDILENEWFKSHKKDYYSVSDVLEYAFARDPFLKESVKNDEDAADTKETLKRQIRRTMKKNFELERVNTSFSYKVDEAEAKYLVNVLLEDYWHFFEIPEIRRKMLFEATEKFCNFFNINMEDLINGTYQKEVEPVMGEEEDLLMEKQKLVDEGKETFNVLKDNLGSVRDKELIEELSKSWDHMIEEKFGK